jgi:type II secretion system protein G
MNKHIKKLFTIIELLAAIVIIIILMGITVGVYSYISTKTKNDRTEATIKKLEMAMRSYRHDIGYSFQQSALGNLSINTSDSEFLKHISYSRMDKTNEISDGIAVDAWGNPIKYQCPGSHNTKMFDLISYGKNGIDNSGAGDDITNFSKN